MAKSCSVTVELGQLIDAAKHTGPKRAPAGAKGSIAKTTLLYGQGDHLMVDTPMIATGVQILEGEWIKKVECHPFHFLETLEKAAKIWKDVGGRSAQVKLEHETTTLSIIWQGDDGRRTLSLHSLRLSS